MNGRLLQKVVSGGGGHHPPEGLMGGVRGEQEVGVNQKTVKGQKTEVRASREPGLGKGLIAGGSLPLEQPLSVA